LSVERTAIEGLLVLRWPTHEDDRGFFRQSAQAGELEEELGRAVTWRQSNHARSAASVLRGFHADPWDKRVYVARGTAFAAVADVRPQSATFGRVVTLRIGDPPGDRVVLFIAEGLANAYCVEGPATVDYLYDVSVPWRADHRRIAVAWDDPDLAVDWPVHEPVLSAADQANPSLRACFPGAAPGGR
jgi:dTDP-4-dehydrorhamnose 3,5-epimerase